MSWEQLPPVKPCFPLILVLFAPSLAPLKLTMKSVSDRSIAQSSIRASFRASAVLLAAMTALSVTAATIDKANNNTALDQTGSWTGAVIPTSGDTVNWNAASGLTVSTGTTDLNITGITFGGSVTGNNTIQGAYNGSTSFTFDFSSDTLTLAGHGLSNGQLVYLSGGTAPTGLALNTPYYVVNAATDTLKLSSTLAGSAIDFTTNGTTPAIRGGGASVYVGTGGINLSSLPAARTVTIVANTVLNGSQTWTAGSTANTAQLTVTGIISGSGALTLAGNSSGGIISLSGPSIFTGGLTINSGATVKFGAASLAAGGVITSGANGTGNLTINGGTLYGGVDIGAPSITVAGDFAVNVGTNSSNGRLGLGGPMDLGSATRTVTLGRTGTVSSALSATSIRFNQITNGPATSVANGTLRFVSDTVGSSGWVGVNIQNAANFTNNAGLTIGSNVITTTGTSSHFSSGSNSPTLTVEAGGIFNTSDGNTASRSSNLAGLNGAGTVTNLDTDGTATNGGQSVITVGNNNTSGNFSGKILDGTTANTQLSLGLTVAATSTVALTKTGSGIQILSGANSYSGATTISAGTIQLGASNTLPSASAISISSGGAKLDMKSFSNASDSLTFTGGGILAFDLTTPGNSTALLSLTNSLTRGGAGTWTIDLSGSSGGIGDYKLISFAGTTFSVGNFTALLPVGYAGSFALNSNDLTYSVSAIPEPSSFAALAGLGILGFAAMRRRRAA